MEKKNNTAIKHNMGRHSKKKRSLEQTDSDNSYTQQNDTQQNDTHQTNIKHFFPTTESTPILKRLESLETNILDGSKTLTTELKKEIVEIRELVKDLKTGYKLLQDDVDMLRNENDKMKEELECVKYAHKKNMIHLNDIEQYSRRKNIKNS